MNLFYNDQAGEINSARGGKSELIGQFALNIFGKHPVRIRIQSVVGAEG